MANYQITDKETPIIIVVGPASSGKSMIMVRLSKYLKKQGYKITPIDDYINTPKYQDDCKIFEDCVNSGNAMPGSVTDLLVGIRDSKGNQVAQYLEAPGEDYFKPDDPNAPAAPYLQNICSGAVPNKKIFIYLLDLDSNPDQKHNSLRVNEPLRQQYENRLLTIFKPHAQKKDKFILLYNKIDLTPFGTTHQIINMPASEKEARAYYPTIFNNMRKSILGGFITYDDFKYIAFSTGSYSDDTDDQGNPIKQYNISGDDYPTKLWNAIMSRL